MNIVVVGLSHHTAPVELRERVAFGAQQACEAAAQLRSFGILEEALVLSTCNRSELYGVTPNSATHTTEALERFFASYHHLHATEMTGSLYRHQGRNAVRHLYRVAAGLDSMLLGEAEVLRQVREAYRAALGHGVTGCVLNRVFQSALQVGKRVRAETGIGTRPISVAFAGVKLAEQILGQFDDKRALILGAGATSEQVVRYLCERRIQEMRIVNRTPEKAQELAARCGGQAELWEHITSALEWPDLIVTSVSSSDAILTRELFEKAMAARGQHPLLVIDLGVPRNVTASAASVPKLYLYNVDDLTLIVERNKKARQNEIPRAEAIIDDQIDKFVRWQESAHERATRPESSQQHSAESGEVHRRPLVLASHRSEQHRN